MTKTAMLPRPCVETIVQMRQNIVCAFDQAIKMARYWPIPFCVFIDRDEVDINT